MWQWIIDLSRRQDAYGNTFQRWLAAAAVFLIALIVLRLLKAFLARRTARWAEANASAWPAFLRGLIERTRTWFLLLAALYCGSRVLTLPEETASGLKTAAVVVLLLQAALWGNALLSFAVIHYSRQRLATDAASATTISVLGFLAKLALWALVILVALDNLGINVTALVAGLGIGGIAVALAAQNILGDLFASLSIMIDRPFVLGDSIAVDGFQGTVENIGVKTTRLRSLSGEELVFANGDLLKSRIRNYKRMTERRVQFTVGVAYQTPHAKLAQLPALLREIVESQSPIRFDRAHFKALGDSSLVFEVVYVVLTPGYQQFMDIQQAINLAILERFEQQQIEIAYPTQTVLLARRRYLERNSSHDATN
jgi:small-conductance mechanosensitive channel